MSDRPTDSNDLLANGPLFQGMDDAEGEIDVTRESVVGSEGTFRAPTVPAGTTPTSAPIPPTALPDLLTERDREARDRD
ncbi:MAG: hypothetical protein M3R24_40770 [Chloroflexota bacterium]|nr:hypothetical protein [Chloroflexota bacterium]PLS79255.1 MAG: hypothetical protein CYG59_13825 [Chloroflexota bacterium]